MKEKKSEILEQVVQTPLGYYELLNKPTQNELNVYYSQKYYQNEHSNYRKSYSEEEINYFRAKNEQKLLALHSVISELQGSMLDIGCGEAFTMAFFKEQGWATTGLDYSHFGCEQMNPQCLPDLITGDIYMGLKSLISQERKFTVIWASNVLEHVLDPVELLLELKHLLQPGGVLVIQVPNDFSFYQSFLLENKFQSLSGLPCQIIFHTLPTTL
jgi:2-polyprenyl-3-methyl-5-hydroxy-6-metoxy-1,4-benzoquinol methylase